MNIQEQLYSKNNLNDIGNKLIYFNSAQRRVFHCKLRNKAAVLPGIE